ncbi:MAG: tetratricopeptide repeat protein [Pseudomonadota bacterium]
MGLPEWFDTLVAAALLITLPVVIVVSWVYELTPDGLKKTEEVDLAASVAPRTGHRLDLFTLAGVVLVIGLVAFQQFDGPKPSAPAETVEVTESKHGPTTAAAGTLSAVGALEKSIAVLPFVAMSDSKDDEFFADGLSEELLNVLAKINGLKVAGRTSSFYYKNKNEDLRKIAGALGVAHILEGSVRRSGATLRVTAQLIQADDGFHLWSETFDRTDGDVFAIQDEIASNVAAAMRAELIGESSGPTRPPRNLEAQNLYLIAQAALAERNLDDVKRARDLFAEARAISPETPQYAAGYAHAVALLYWNFRAISPDEAISNASEAIDQALTAGEPSADTLAIAGLVEELRAITVSDPSAKRRALDFYQQALRKDLGNVLALQWLASIYIDTNDFPQAKDYYERALELDPLNILALSGLASAQMAMGEVQKARNHLYKVQALFPESALALRYLSNLEWYQGRLDRSLFWGERGVQIDPNPQELFAQATGYLLLDQADRAMTQLDVLKELDGGLDVRSIIRARLEEDYPTAAAEADRLFAETGHEIFAQASSLAYAMSSEYQKAIDILERQYPSLKSEQAEYLDGTDMIPVVLLVHCYQQVGDTSAARRLADLLLNTSRLSDQAFESRPSNRMIRAELLAAIGDEQGALEDLEILQNQAVAVPFNSLAIRVENEPVFRAIADEPVFKAYVEFENQTLKQLARTLASGETEQNVITDIRAAGFELAGR